ncbi:MAG: hypothetical protein R3Y59_11085 [bacterium]
MENANIPNNWGVISLDNYKPYPKNPTIARVFREIGLAEELGYGVRNLFKYCPLLVDGAKPIIEEGDIFKVIIQYDGGGVNGGVNGGVKNTQSVGGEAGAVGGVVDGDDDGGVNGGVNCEVLSIISDFGGVNSSEIKSRLPEISQRSIERAIKELRSANKIEFRGAPKIGGYFLVTDKK